MIVGLTGYAGSGKDTAAAVLLVKGYERIAFADKLKEGLYALNPIVAAVPEVGLVEHGRENMGVKLAPGVGIEYLRLADAVDAVGWDEAKKLGEIRALAQRYGTEAGRNIHGSQCWVDLAMEQLIPGVDYVFTDARFASEVEAIQRAGGIIVRIDRPGTEPVNTHVSDTGVDDLHVDYTILNDGTIGQLHQRLLDLVT